MGAYLSQREELTEEDFVRILTTPKNALNRQYQNMTLKR